MSLRKKTITGIIWNICEQVARKGIGVVITLLLARFLAPADFGLIAMMLTDNPYPSPLSALSFEL